MCNAPTNKFTGRQEFYVEVYYIALSYEVATAYLDACSVVLFHTDQYYDVVGMCTEHFF